MKRSNATNPDIKVLGVFQNPYLIDTAGRIYFMTGIMAGTSSKGLVEHLEESAIYLSFVQETCVIFESRRNLTVRRGFFSATVMLEKLKNDLWLSKILCLVNVVYR